MQVCVMLHLCGTAWHSILQQEHLHPGCQLQPSPLILNEQLFYPNTYTIEQQATYLVHSNLVSATHDDEFYLPKAAT